MSPKHAIQNIKDNISQTNYDEGVRFRWKTPDEFVYNGKLYKMSEEARKELREDVGKLIRIYINSRECINETR